MGEGRGGERADGSLKGGGEALGFSIVENEKRLPIYYITSIKFRGMRQKKYPFLSVYHPFS